MVLVNATVCTWKAKMCMGRNGTWYYQKNGRIYERSRECNLSKKSHLSQKLDSRASQLQRWRTLTSKETNGEVSNHRRTGRGGWGGAAAPPPPPPPPPQILGNSDFLGSKRNLGKASFKRSFHGFVFWRDRYFLFQPEIGLVKPVKFMRDNGCPARDEFLVINVVHILAVIPATSCSAQRSFSVLRRFKTYLRNTMGQQRVSNVHRTY